jgi:ABC-type lipoprotein export system ATPase subunit
MMERQHGWLVNVRDLTRIYGDGSEIRALDGLNLQVSHGELVAVMGPSGSGKSTLLNILGALDKPTAGEVHIDGQNLAELKDLDHFRASTVGFIFQLHNLLPTLTALENVEVPMAGHLRPGARSAWASELLELVGLPDRMHHLPNQLSGGQRQRVAVARALANHPLLVLADEPTGNLDSAAAQELMDLLRQLNRSQGTTFIVVTHDPAIARQTSRVLVMADGRVIREDVIGSPLDEDLKMWRHSDLGKRIIASDREVVSWLDLSERQLVAIQTVLERANQAG